jgi:nucleolar protein 56
MQRFWFGDVSDGRCISSACDDIPAWADRVAALESSMEGFSPLDWRWAKDCGCIGEREEYIRLLREICFLLAERKIVAFYQRRDVELIQMVLTVDELDRVVNLLMERALEWYRTRDPAFSRKYRPSIERRMIAMMKGDAPPHLGTVIEEIERLSAIRNSLAKEIAASSDALLPNSSAIVGGLVAARLVAYAGGLERLATMPSSAIQVLGAKQALFSHVRSGTPSPKHGIIFQHKRIHNAPKKVRGRVARVLSAKLGIAVRLDYYRSTRVPEFIDDAQARIDEAGRTG